jgi:NADPH:quinone reductase
MRAIQVRKACPTPDVSFVTDLPDPIPGAGEVLIDIRSAALHYPDWLVVTGRYQTIPPAPFVPGKEAAGIVCDLGEGVTTLKRGDRVLVHVDHGAFASRTAVREDRCMPLPASMEFIDAVAIGLAAQTAWFALVERGGLKHGMSVLVNGATGAVGHAAVQIASSLGATVLAGVNSPERAKPLLEDVACSIIDLGGPQLRNTLREQVLAATNGRGADIVIDMLGGDVFDASLRAMAWDGRLVSVGFAAGRIPEVKTGYLLVKNLSVAGLQWTDYRDREPAKVARAHAALAQMWEHGALCQHIMRPVPMEQFEEALHLIENRQARGRLILKVD